mmetsp:Transcript_16885/g.58800  ORF Transcript_16885/g.58800 Transcript_16885/m.58800 type:complete len:202 (+) Transcript_16885:1714-2319(+)
MIRLMFRRRPNCRRRRTCVQSSQRSKTVDSAIIQADSRTWPWCASPEPPAAWRASCFSSAARMASAWRRSVQPRMPRKNLRRRYFSSLSSRNAGEWLIWSSRSASTATSLRCAVSSSAPRMKARRSGADMASSSTGERPSASRRAAVTRHSAAPSSSSVIFAAKARCCSLADHACCSRRSCTDSRRSEARILGGRARRQAE